MKTEAGRPLEKRPVLEPRNQRWSPPIQEDMSMLTLGASNLSLLRLPNWADSEFAGGIPESPAGG